MKNQNVVFIPELKEPEGKYSYADEVHEIAASVINKWHSGLAEAKIAYLFKDAKSWNSKGKVILAKTYKVPEQWQYLSGYDILIIVNLNAWELMSIKQKEALVDHELCHILKDEDGMGYPKYSMVDHDVEEFSAVVQRHGLWISDLKNFMNAAQQMTIETFEAEK